MTKINIQFIYFIETRTFKEMKLTPFNVKNHVSMFTVFFFNCSLIHYLYVCIFDMYFLKKKNTKLN